MALRPIFYDTETTGINSQQDRIIEIAAFDPQLNRTFVSLVNPGIPIPAGATAIHHITNEMVASSPDFSKVGKDFTEFCEGEVVLIAHNNDNFDLLFLRCEYERHQLQIPEWKYFDTLKWARRYRSDLPKHTLQFLREVYGLEPNQAHRALDDVMILYKVFTEMTDDLPLEEVYALLNAPKQIHHMPFGKYQGQPLNKVPADYIRWLAGNGAFDKAENKELFLTFEKLGMLPSRG